MIRRRFGRRAPGGLRLGVLMGLVGLAGGLLARPAVSQSDPGIRVHMHGAEGYAADGMLYRPSASETTRPAALLLIPDERGLTPRTVEAATTFMAAGYLVVAVDLNRGMPAAAAAHDEEQVDHDLRSAFAFVCAQAHVGGSRVGLVGWGSGGAAALRLAGETEIRAVAIDGAAPLQAYPRVGTTRAAILGSFAGRRSAQPTPSPREIEARLRTLAQSVTVKTYSAADTGFDDPEDAVHYRPADAADVLSRESQFFAARLSD